MAATQVKIMVPGNHLMAGLLGERDELLRLIEAAFGDTSVVGRLVRDIIDYQSGTSLQTSRSGLTESDLALASTRALNWALDATRGLLVA